MLANTSRRQIDQGRLWMARSPSRSRSRSPRKGDRRRVRDWRGDRERERDKGYERDRDRDWEIKSRGDRGRDRDRGDRGDRADRGDRGDRADRGDRGDRGDRADRGDRGDRGRARERERGRSGSPRHDHQRHSDDYEARRDIRGQGRSRDTGIDLTEVERLHKKGADSREDEVMKDSEGQRAAIVAEFVDGIVREHEQLAEASFHSPPKATLPPGPPAVPQPDEEDLMKKMGIPAGFNTTKGKYVGDANHSAVKLTTKRTPRQYMNRRGGFNRPLPAETNR